jgi:hypothetical protein
MAVRRLMKKAFYDIERKKSDSKNAIKNIIGNAID